MLQVEFRVGSCVPPDLHIRAMPVYSEAAHFREAVRRCPNHASAADPTNANFPHPRHLVRADTETSRYEEDEASGRLSVIFPVQPPHWPCSSSSSSTQRPPILHTLSLRGRG